QDISAQVLDAFEKSPRVMLPEVNGLADFLEKPIPDSMKIPLLQHEYDSFLIRNMEDMCTSEDLNILFRVSETENAYGFTSKMIGPLIWNDPPSREKTEYSYVSFWDANIRFPLELFIPDGTSIRNSSQHMGIFSKWPNFGFILNHVCLFRGEEKSSINDEDAKAELRDKLYWIYDPAPYVLGYYANRSDVTFVAICRPLHGYNPDVINIVKSNLNRRRGRILNLRRMINLSILIKSLQDVIGWHESPEFRPIIRKRQTIIVCAKNIKKTFTNRTESDERVEKLRNLGVVYLGPKGMSVKPKNQKELLEAVVCILEALVAMHGGDDPIFHQDIRWPNIIRLPGASNEPSKWILIDWDEADGPPTQPATHLATENHAPEVFQKDHHGEVDIWSVGELITAASKWIFGLSSNLIEFGKELQSDNRPTAQNALEKLKSFLK
ncbi:14701_t:CDS:2, partial [Ambispora leptoticha]